MASEIVLFETEDKEIKLLVPVENETVWLNRSQLADLFERDVKTIGKHINNALKEELSAAVVAKFATTAALEWNEKFVFCLDNDMMYAEEMIYKIEKRTGVDFRNIKIKGQKEDFTGLRFFNGGWKRDFWGNFPSKDEIEAYIKLKNGKR